MSKIKNGGLDQYGPGPFEQSSLEQLALKGLKARSGQKIKINSSSVKNGQNEWATCTCFVPVHEKVK